MRSKGQIVVIVSLLFSSPVIAEEDLHEHDKQEHEEHEENSQVGKDKGIIEATEIDGIKLSIEAEKSFEIVRSKVAQTTIEIPDKAIVKFLAEVNVFRFRNGFYKRIDFEYVKRLKDKVQIKSKDLKIGDEVVVRGLEFLRLAEISAFGGAPEGHSH